MFNIKQGHQITDEELYILEGKIPVLTGRNELKGYWGKSLVSNKDLPCITYPTKGNNDGDVYIQYNLFDANNTAVIIPLPEWRDKISLEWVVFKLRHLFREVQTSKEGVSYLNRELVNELNIDVPDMNTQLKELKNYKILQIIKKRLESALEETNSLLDKTIK